MNEPKKLPYVPGEPDAEVDSELRFHLEQRIEANIAAGMSPEAARRAAEERFGDVAGVREECARLLTAERKTRRRRDWFDDLRQDLRFAVRSALGAPMFTMLAVLTLALGIGANAAMFGVVDRLMFRPHPYLRDPGHVHRVYLQLTDRDRQVTRGTFEYTRYLDLRRWTTSFSDHAAYADGAVAIGVGQAARQRPVEAVSASFFGFFDARPALGRFFVAAEDSTPIGAAVAVLDHTFWQTDYGRRNVLGETIRIGNTTYTIIGVAPEGFSGASEGASPAVYIPITTYAGTQLGPGAREYYLDYSWG